MLDVIQKPTIGIFIDTFFPNNDLNVNIVDHYASHLKDIFNVIIFTPQAIEKDYQDKKDYTVYRSKYLKVPFTNTYISLGWFDYEFRKILHQIKLDLVHIHSPFHMGNIGLRYAKKHKLPCIGSIYYPYVINAYELNKKKPLTESMLNDMTLLMNQCDELWALNPCVIDSYPVIGNKQKPILRAIGTDLTPIKDDSEVNALKKQYGLKSEDKILLYVGEFVEQKNLSFLLESLYRLRLKGFKFMMICVGSGQYLLEMQKWIRKYGLTDKVIVIDWINDQKKISNHYKLADLLLIPSKHEVTSRVFVEAASQKCPSLVISNSSLSCMLSNDVNGFISDLDPTLYAERIIQIFKNNKNYQKVREQAYKDLYQTWDAEILNVKKRYLGIINQKGTTE